MRLALEELGDGQPPASLGEGDDDMAGVRLLDELGEAGQWADQTPVQRQPGAATVVHDADDLVSEVRLGVDLVDDPQGQLARPQNQDALDERPATKRRVDGEPERHEQQAHDQEARQERALGRAGVRKDRVKPREQDEGHPDGLDESRGERGEASCEPEVVEVVVIERDPAAQRENGGAAENAGNVDPVRDGRMAPEQAHDCRRDEEKHRLDDRKHACHSMRSVSVSGRGRERGRHRLIQGHFRWPLPLADCAAWTRW